MRRFFASLFLTLALTLQPGSATAAVYQDYGASPFVKMMLLMMDMFGLLDKVPHGYPGLYGAYPWGHGAYPGWSGTGWPAGVDPFTQPGFANFPPVQSAGQGLQPWGSGPSVVANPWEPIDEAAPDRGRGVGLNGIWQGQGGDLMAIYGDRFLWSDPYNRTLGGRFRIQGDYLVARVAGSGRPLVFRVQKVPGGFIAMDASGRAIRFRRLY